MAPNDELYELNIGNILGGKFPDIFNRALQQVIANIRDQNTPAEAIRKMTFEFTIEPSADRAVGAIHAKNSLKAGWPRAGIRHDLRLTGRREAAGLLS